MVHFTLQFSLRNSHMIGHVHNTIKKDKHLCKVRNNDTRTTAMEKQLFLTFETK